jgi:hypothetical protein
MNDMTIDITNATELETEADIKAGRTALAL